MKYTTLFSAALLSVALVVPQVGQAQAASSSAPVCKSDSTLSSFARQRVNNAATAVQNSGLRLTSFTNSTDLIKQKIDATSLRTGGVLRDIYVGGAQSNDKQGMIEEYFRSQFGSLDDQLVNQLDGKAETIVSILQSNLNQTSAPKGDSRGNASASRSLSSVQTSSSRSGSFKLQQRGSFGLMQDVGRFSYTVNSKATVSVSSIHFNEQYSTCANQSGSNEFGYSAKVTITPVLEVRYQFNHLGSRSSRYQTFSGSYKIIDTDRRIEKELSVDGQNL
jgi:hypothetical protein